MAEADCPLLSLQSKPDLGTIFRDLGEAFLERERLNRNQRRVFHRIGECRTAAMGGTLWQCQDCGQWVGVYHSCRDRHCPGCQAMKRADWVEDRLAELLPVPYFHVVFTLPHELNGLVKNNPRECLGLLFSCASGTLLKFAADPKFLGAVPGILTVLHTWGQKLNLHYHLHCIVTGGGLAADQGRWVSVPKPNSLFPIKALSKVFRGKYLTGLDKLRRQGLKDPPGLSLTSDQDWLSFKQSLAKKKKWNAYLKPPFSTPEHLLEYFAQYTNRIAISNRRILAYDGKTVRFSYKDYRDGCRVKQLTLDVAAFARRFLLHVLPKGFMRIRYYGFLASCKKKASLAICRKFLTLLGQMPPDDKAPPTQQHQDHNATNAEGLELRNCPYCPTGLLVQIRPVYLFERSRARSLLWDTS